MFLYITIYIQGVLGYSPLEAGASLPAADPVLVRRAADTRQPLAIGSRCGCRWASGWRCGRRVAADARRRARLGMDDAACRIPGRGRRHRAHQPGNRSGRDRGRASGPGGHGLGHQHDLAAGRDRDRGRRARRGVPVADRFQVLRSCCPRRRSGLADGVASGGTEAASSCCAAQHPRPGRRRRESPSPSAFNDILLIGALIVFMRRGRSGLLWFASAISSRFPAGGCAAGR